VQGQAAVRRHPLERTPLPFTGFLSPLMAWRFNGEILENSRFFVKELYFTRI
jgi:hypothetical protein